MFDPELAHRGIEDLITSYQHRSEFLAQHPPKPLPSDDVVAKWRTAANRRAIEVVWWVRSVDCYLDGGLNHAHAVRVLARPGGRATTAAAVAGASARARSR